MRLFHKLLFFLLLLVSAKAYSQQDVEFHLNQKFLDGKVVLKVYRDFYDPYLWVLAKNNEVYRVNSLTYDVADYTSTFAAYSNLEFIDIAGRSKDTVFIATNSKNIIYYKNGGIKLIGEADGVPGTVNSIGIEAFRYKPYVSLMIATNNGIRIYNLDTEQLEINPQGGDTKIYASNYRTEMYKDSVSPGSVTDDTIKYQPVTVKTRSTTWRAYLWEGGKQFGYDIKTADNMEDALANPNEVFANFIWGNNRGLFTNNVNYSYYSIFFPSYHYLDGISVNKITDMMGLVAFGDPYEFGLAGLMKQTLLVGTDKGLYFSNSVYGNTTDRLKGISFFHDDELGNVVVNDICVNAASTTMPICEDGAWVATNNGLFYLKPDYSRSITSSHIGAAHFKDQDDSISDIKICADGDVTAEIRQNLYSGNTIQWYKNSIEIPLASADTLKIKTAGEYYAILYDPCSNVRLETNHLTVEVITAPVIYKDFPPKAEICDATSGTLTFNFQNPNSQYNSLIKYRWYTDGVLNGETSMTYTVTKSGKYRCEVSTCANSWISSKEIDMSIINLPVPEIQPDKALYCDGEQATLTVNVPQSADYTINWYRDGTLLDQFKNNTNIKTGQPGKYSVILSSTIGSCVKPSELKEISFISKPDFTFNYDNELKYCEGTPVTLKANGSIDYKYRWYKDGVLTGDVTQSINILATGSYNVEVSACEGSWVPSKTVKVDLVKIPVPVISRDKAVYCMGDNATLTVNAGTDALYTINWYRDDTLLTDAQNKTAVTTSVPGNYSVKITGNGVDCSQTSAVQPLVFNQEPTVSIEKIIKTTLCDGQTVDLKVEYSGGTVQWSTGESGNQVSVAKSGIYKATVTSASGCTADGSVSINFLPKPVFTVKDTSVCTFTNQNVILKAPDGFKNYSWNNGASTQQTYLVTTPQTVTLTVTDNNDCQATQQVVVASQCPDVHVPNTFTPNHDGINDTWNIEGLENDHSIMIRVYTRYGALVYQGAGTSWDGTYRGGELPAGVYYYVINAKNNQLKLSGSITIIR